MWMFDILIVWITMHVVLTWLMNKIKQAILLSDVIIVIKLHAIHSFNHSFGVIDQTTVNRSCYHNNQFITLTDVMISVI